MSFLSLLCRTLQVSRVSWLLLYFRSEEHTSELQSQSNLVCRLLLEKKKKQQPAHRTAQGKRDRLCSAWRAHSRLAGNLERDCALHPVREHTFSHARLYYPYIYS